MSNIISLTGDLGSGKSTVSATLCKILDYEYVYTGQIQRKIAERYRMTTNELNIHAEMHPEIDEEIDSTFKALNNSKKLIVDSRLAWFFIPASFKVFLKTNLVISAQRISVDKQRINENYASHQEATLKIVERKASEVKRYQQYYGVNCLDLTNYNLIIDTSFITPQRVADIILQEFEHWQQNPNLKKTYISPKNLYPTAFYKSWFSEDTENVKVAYINLFDYIVEGHKVVSEAIKKNVELISVDYSIDNVLFDNLNEKINEWEKTNHFKYLIYPDE
ncbi:MAG: cytidylate kinase family protein [Prevotellaceae bacterium]|jgi:cytidylate kinase|nr:cytidylate kinase family protein [Prevotellaceae bacterium]